MLAHRMNEEYKETGGLRWGQTFWGGMNATWPFVTLRATHDKITIRLTAMGMMTQSFDFPASMLTCIRRKRGLLPFNTGVVFEHSNPAYPPFILFWTFRYHTLKKQLADLGFDIKES